MPKPMPTSFAAPRTTEVKLVRLAETGSEAKINGYLAEGLVMLQCVGFADVMVMLRYATPFFDGRQEIRLVRLGEIDAEQVINDALRDDFMPMGHVGTRSQYLLMMRTVEATPHERPRSVASTDEPASMAGLPVDHDSDQHDAESCQACQWARAHRHDN